MRLSAFLALVLLSVVSLAVCSQELTISRTQSSNDIALPPDTEGTPLAPQEALKRITVPEGFRVTLFAAEPDIRQPIAMTFDDRGRLWVAECYSYPDWKPKGRDRVVILEDTDNDGRHDRRKVFWDKGNSLSGIEYGYGGIWVSCAPRLLFIPDKNGDDVPDGEPVVLLDGWTTDAKHNMFNGLKWGPDGWLYGCHGILATSNVGAPGTPPEKRVKLNCGIWRYHPIRKTFEVVCHGTTNPWGLDFNEYGEGFFTNCVIEHLFHMIPGAHYKRMYGQDFNPYLYELMDATSDHLHWGGGHWTESRTGEEHDSPGGGHAHSGTLVYLGENFPKEYYGTLFTCNIHGHRVNNDSLERRGSGWVGKHRPDFFNANDPWFRGVALAMGPDGGMYIADWSDTGECHDYEDVHRGSGRIYKVTYGKTEVPPYLVPVPPGAPDSSDPFVGGEAEDWRKMMRGFKYAWYARDEWLVRHYMRWLAEQEEYSVIMGHHPLLVAEDQKPKVAAKSNVKPKDLPKLDVRGRVRVLFSLHATWDLWRKDHANGKDPSDTYPSGALLSDKEPLIRATVIRLQFDHGAPPVDILQKCEQLARLDDSPQVRLALCSALQKLPAEKRWEIIAGLAGRAEDETDANIPLMLWYAIEPCVPQDPARALQLAKESKLSKVRKYIVRRLAEADLRKERLPAVVAAIGELDTTRQRDMLHGMFEALRGLKTLPLPHGWEQLAARLATCESDEVRELAYKLAIVFNDPAAIAALKKTALDETAPPAERAAAIDLLAERRAANFASELFALLDDPTVRLAALRGLSAYDEYTTPDEILKRYSNWNEAERIEAINTLASRVNYARALIDALEQRKIPRSDVSPFHARQLAALKNPDTDRRLAEVWGTVKPTADDKAAMKQKYKSQLTDEVIAQANLPHGRAVFARMCGQCHFLFGEGAKIGPELTGAQRGNLDYVLENLIDPNAIIGQNYQMTTAVLNDGRVVSGVIDVKNDATVTLKTTSGKTMLQRSEIEELQTSPVSMMPEGQIDKLTPAELRDLVAYLRSPRQVELPEKER